MREQVVGAVDAGGAEINGLEDPAVERQQLRGEAELALLEAAGEQSTSGTWRCCRIE